MDEKHPTPDDTVNPEDVDRRTLRPHERVLILDMWQRSGLAAREFGALVGLSRKTLFDWKRRFERLGPAGLADQRRGAPTGSRLPEATQRAILMLKAAHPEWGCERIREVLLRGEGYSASAGAIAHVLRENGYELESVETSPNAPQVQHFERARPNQLWQTDLFTFLLKRENRRVYLVAFLDDHSRFVVGYGVYASAGGALVREVLEAAIANYGAPEEVLTDNGPQYVTWRGTSAFARLLERRGIRHVIARPRHPQTLGKTERFWGTLWRECVQSAVFAGLDDARRRVGHFIDHYNFQRPHQGIDGLVPADRYFAAAPQVRETLQARVASNAHDLAVHGAPRKSFYLTGRVGDTDIALHSEGSRVVLTRSDGGREEVDLEATGRRAEDPPTEVMPEPLAPTVIRTANDAEADPADDGDAS
jgi:transposase InsO family protein